MKNKTKETVRQFVGVSPEWEAAVVKTATCVLSNTKKMLKRPPNRLWTFEIKCLQRRILNG